MIKLKDLLKESYAWERKFGEKLPTLADVQKKKLTEGYGYLIHQIVVEQQELEVEGGLQMTQV